MNKNCVVVLFVRTGGKGSSAGFEKATATSFLPGMTEPDAPAQSPGATTFDKLPLHANANFVF